MNQSRLLHPGPGVSKPRPEESLYDSMGLWKDGKPNISAWGTGCGRGIQYKDMGGPLMPGTKNVVRKISSGRKAHRGMASDGVSAA
jgi:hypothetical protein